MATDREEIPAQLVSEHMRRYKNGEIVKVKAHHRGQDPTSGDPNPVKGPGGDT